MTEARWLDSEQTAAYICVRVDRLPRLAKAGKIPKPDYSLGVRSPRWDRVAIDKSFGSGAGSRATMDWQKEIDDALEKVDQIARSQSRSRR